MENEQDISFVMVEDQKKQLDIEGANSDTQQNGSVSAAEEKLFVKDMHQESGELIVEDQTEQLHIESENSDTTQKDCVSADEKKLFVVDVHQEIQELIVKDQTQQLDIADADIPAFNGNTRQNDRISVCDRKLFIGGMHQETGEQDLRDHFGKYGDIEHIKVKIDPSTGRSRGFAFIVFKSSEALGRIEAASDHVINGKRVDPQKAKTRQGKIFVGGLSSDLTDEDIKTHFAQFGTIVEAQMPFDKIKNQRKGFCFIVFESEDVIKNLLRNPRQNIKGKEVYVKKAEQKPDQLGGSMMGGRGGMRGGSGGYGMRGFNQGYFGSYYESMNVSIMRGRGGLRGARGGKGSNAGYGQCFTQGNVPNFGIYEQAYNCNANVVYRGGYGQCFTQGNVPNFGVYEQDYNCNANVVYRGGYGQRYQPY